MSGQMDAHSALAALRDEGWIGEVLHEVRGGKEATVFCCAGGPAAAAMAIDTPDLRSPEGPGPDAQAGGVLRPPFVAVKFYRPRMNRTFRNDAVYRGGRLEFAHNSRVRRALEAGSAFGREAQQALWIDHEWEVLATLHHAGVDVPVPLHRVESAIVMSFVGDEATGGAAPALHEAALDRDEVEAVTDRLLANIERMLDAHVVHGDLSSYNVLYDPRTRRAVIIDFPQAVDPRLNPAAAMLLERDIANICAWARKRGIDRDAPAIAREMWERFEVGEIG